MTCCRAIQSEAVVGGGGAVEMEVSAFLREKAREISGKQQLIINAYARSLEVIPRVLSANSGLDATDVLNKLRQLHNRKDGDRLVGTHMCTLSFRSQLHPCSLSFSLPSDKNRWMGVDCMNLSEEGVMDTVENFVWEPVMVKLNSFAAAAEAACSILSVDEMVKNPKSNPEPNAPGAVKNRGTTIRH